MIWRSGRRPSRGWGEQHDAALGVERPGAPTPTPRISASGCSRRVTAMARSASPTRRRARRRRRPPMGRLAGGRDESEPSSATLPNTRLVPPISTPSTYRRRSSVLEMAATARPPARPTAPACSVMSQRARFRSMRRAGSAGSDGCSPPVSGPARSEAERRHLGPNTATTGGAHGRGQCSGAESLVTSTAALAISAVRRGAEHPAREGPSGGCGCDCVSQRRVLTTPYDYDRRRERGGELRVVRPAFVPQIDPAPSPRTAYDARDRSQASASARHRR